MKKFKLHETLDIRYYTSVPRRKIYYEHTLNSLPEQGEVDLEIVCVNDASPDQSRNLVAKWMKQYSSEKIHLSLIDLPHNCGVSVARNRGIISANGKYLFFLDGDDLLLPGSLQAMTEAMELHELDILSARHLEFFSDQEYSCDVRLDN